MDSKKGRSKYISSHTSFSRKHLIVFISIFAVIGGAILLSSYAANPNLPGDINSDNKVDVTDLSILLSNYGTSNTVADLNSDNKVDITDLSILLSNYGKTYTPPATTTISQTITNGSTLSGTITWLATTSNDSNVNSVSFYVDNVLRNTETAAPWASADPPRDDLGQVNTSQFTNGSHTFKATANLKDGTTVSVTSTATVNNTTTPLPTTVNCTKYASVSGSDSAAGTLTSPYLTPQKLADNLSAGQTGCLRGGTYTQSSVRFNRGGVEGSPITLTSYPGERAKLLGGFLYTPPGSNFVSFENLDIDGSGSPQVTIQILSSNVTIKNNDITNNHNAQSCIILSSYGAGMPTVYDVNIEANKIHNCGMLVNGEHDHGIYVSNSYRTKIIDNLFYDNQGGWGIQLWTSAHYSIIEHNVIDANYGGNIIIAGQTTNGFTPSSNNIIRYNILSFPRDAYGVYNVESYWADTPGTNNTVTSNCVYRTGSYPNFDGGAGYTQSGNLITDPKYVDRATKNFRLQTNSPCLSVVQYDTAAKLNF